MPSWDRPPKVIDEHGNPVPRKFFNGKLRLNTPRNVSLAMQRIIRQGAIGELDQDLARSLIWQLQQLLGVLRQEVEAAEIEKRIAAIEATLTKRVLDPPLVDRSRIRQLLDLGPPEPEDLRAIADAIEVRDDDEVEEVADEPRAH